MIVKITLRWIFSKFDSRNLRNGGKNIPLITIKKYRLLASVVLFMPHNNRYIIL